MRVRMICILWGVCMGICVCCSESGFTAEEQARIGSQQGKVMRLYTLDVKTDSLLLRQIARSLTIREVKSEEYRMLKEGLLLTVRDTLNPGVGIAAPQVGISRKLICVQRFDKEGEPFECYINPEITYYSSEKSCGAEGCLSVPDVRGTVERAEEIAVCYTDEATWQQKCDTVKGFTAVIFQHETDHLNGVLFVDKLMETSE